MSSGTKTYAKKTSLDLYCEDLQAGFVETGHSMDRYCVLATGCSGRPITETKKIDNPTGQKLLKDSTLYAPLLSVNLV